MKPTIRKFVIAAVCTLLPAGVTFSQQANSAEAKLRAAMDKETVDGDLKGAIELYNKIAQGKDRATAARALIRMANAYEKLGDAESRRVYQSIVRDFPDQKEAVAYAQTRLGGSGSATLTKRVVDHEPVSPCYISDGYLSPDARWSMQSDLGGDIVICDLSTGQISQLFVKTDSNVFPRAQTPVPSPDSRQVVYSWDLGKGQNAQLRIVAREPRSKPRILVDNPQYSDFLVQGWLPDGKSVLVTIHNTNKTYQLARITTDAGQVTVLKSLDEWRLRNVPGRAQPSPDGRYITYGALAASPNGATAPQESADQHIFVVGVNGSPETEVVKTAGVNRDPFWSPDGKHILFISDRSGPFGLWSIPVTNGKAIDSASLVAGELGDIRPWGLRNGSYFYPESRERVESIAILNAKPNSVADRTTATEMFAGLAPSWSPDGKSIAFKRHLPGGKSDDYVLVARSVETGDERTYPTSLGATGLAPATWFHDNKSLLTGLHRPDGTESRFRVDLKNGEFKELPTVPDRPGLLSPDDKTLYVVSREGPGRNANGLPLLGQPDRRPDKILAVDLSTGQQRQVFESPAVGPNQGLAIALSPDGRTLAVGWLEIQPAKVHIGTMSVGGGDFREVYASDNPLYGAGILKWTPDGNSILFRQEQPPDASHWGMMRIPAQGGAPASLILRSSVMTGFDLSPDGSRFVIGDRVFVDHLVVLDNVLSVLK
jgi:Tol biopolymer transport system component